jgi:hypothetical protein
LFLLFEPRKDNVLNARVGARKQDCRAGKRPEKRCRKPGRRISKVETHAQPGGRLLERYIDPLPPKAVVVIRNSLFLFRKKTKRPQSRTVRGRHESFNDRGSELIRITQCLEFKAAQKTIFSADGNIE